MRYLILAAVLVDFKASGVVAKQEKNTITAQYLIITLLVPKTKGY